MLNKKTLVLVLMATSVALSACGGGQAEQLPTPDVALIQTLAVGTFQAGLTQTALVVPTTTPLPTNTPLVLATNTPLGGGSALSSPTSPSGGGAGAAACYDLAYVQDVTIPDGTVVTPGQSFTKTWLVQNSGSCDWEPGFIFNVVGGDPMSGASVTLNQIVQPGRQYELSVPMVAPTDKTGELKGTWRLSDANGNFFGDGVYVLVDVGNATAVPTAATATETPTPTP
jgi:hypothetical protein